MSYFSHLVKLTRFQKRFISVLIDVVGLLILAVVAIWLRFGEAVFPITDYIPAIAVLVVLAIPVFIQHGLYRAIVRYIGYRFALTVFVSVTSLYVIWAAVLFFADLPFPRSAIIISWLLTLLYISFTRLAARWLLSEGMTRKYLFNRKRAVIFGAGSSGQQLLSAMKNITAYKVVGFIDDSVQLQKHDINSVTVYRREDLQKLISDNAVSEIFLAIPGATTAQKKSILNWLELYSLKVSTLPPLDQIVDGKVSFNDIRQVDVEDLLGRDVVPADEELLSECVKDQVVMITGAGGSIGSELCRQVVKLRPKQLILFEISEFALYAIEYELRDSNVEVLAMLGSVTDKAKLEKIIQSYQVDTIYHAAAYKHVPIVEHNIEEGLVNNTFGTLVLAKTAAENSVKNFVLISTDKAVRPTNFMGASKRMAEMVLQAIQVENPLTRFVMVRFGNVLGSSGSVIPLFRKQIENGGPVTVTHKEITRYFMTISEAASLVIQAGSMGQGGDVFVLDMGEPVKISDLAKHVIKLSGLEVVDDEGNGDIEIHYTGLRPGEKLYEELLIGDNVDGTEHPRIMKAHEDFIELEQLEIQLNELKLDMEQCHYDGIVRRIEHLVSGFKHNSGIVDYLAK